MSFNTVGEENGEALVNDGAKHPPCSRCGCTNHTVELWFAKNRGDGKMLHNLGEVEEVEYEINNAVSTEMTVQPDINSLVDQSNTSSETIGIPNTWILLDSQSTITHTNS